MATKYALTLASNAGTGAGTPVAWPGGYLQCTFEGTTPAGALQMQTDNGTWLNVGTSVTFTANGLGGAFLAPCNVRINITGGSAVYCYATLMPQYDVTGG